MVAYRDAEGTEHMAIVKGDVTGDDVLCRVHSECLTGEVFGSRRCECGPQLERALQRIEESGRGVVVYLRGHEGRGIGLINKIRAYALQDEGADTLEANQLLGFQGDMRSYDVAAQILADLGVRSVALMTNNPTKVEGLEDCGVRVMRRVEHHVGVHDDNRFYIETKVARMGHLIELDEARGNGVD
ncbi:MAG: GTP cyclohydrolase II [Myxococcales bacterium]|nr:GTP cyclohydrolase II [Myxococcales bacterium]